jgi:hypothetical protein
MPSGNRAKMLAQFRKLIDAFSDPIETDETIYHYTSAEGLRGILDSNEIWLTNTEFVNDTTECKALEQKKDLFAAGDLTNEHVRKAWETFVSRPYQHNKYYIGSFNKKGESLDQFRAYGPYCIGFDVAKLKNTKAKFSLYKCVYSDKDIKDWILEKEQVAEWNGDSLSDRYKETAAFDLIFAASIKFKNEVFSAEQEVRLLTVSNHTWGMYANSPSMYEKERPIHFRDHPILKTPVPYVKFFLSDTEFSPVKPEGEIDPKEIETEHQMKARKMTEESNMTRKLLPVKEIIIGPMPHQKQAETSCEILLSEKGHEDVTVIPSEIPYRGF